MTRLPPVARALAVGSLAALLLALAAGQSVRDARSARAALAAARSAERAPPPALPRLAPRSAIAAADADAAGLALANRLRQQAVQGGLLVERARPVPSPGAGIVAVDLAVSGSEKAVLALADALPRGRPAVGLYEWDMVAVDQANVRLTGSAVASWR